MWHRCQSLISYVRLIYYLYTIISTTLHLLSEVQRELRLRLKSDIIRLSMESYGFSILLLIMICNPSYYYYYYYYYYASMFLPSPLELGLNKI
jgi:hypothetical protein